MKKLLMLLLFICLMTVSSLANAEGTYRTSDNGLYYLEFTGDKGKNGVIFLHGNPGSKKWVKKIIDKDTNTYKILERISQESGRYTFAIARPGFSKSKGRAGKNLNKHSYRDSHVEEIVTCMKELKDKYKLKAFTVFGFSAGASIGAEISLRHPELVSDVVLFEGGYDTSKWAKLKMKKRERYEMNPMNTLDEVAPPSIPFTIYYGTKSKYHTSKLSEEFAEKLREKGATSVEIIKVPCGHFGFFEEQKIQDDLVASF